jgi:hypothetical protein
MEGSRFAEKYPFHPGRIRNIHGQLEVNISLGKRAIIHEHIIALDDRRRRPGPGNIISERVLYGASQIAELALVYLGYHLIAKIFRIVGVIPAVY